MANTVLAGLRILDFGRYIAGPFCATLLADLGADVIRVERREGGEDRFLYPVTPAGDGALFLQMNRNKRGITLDPKAPGGQDVLRRLVASADVVVANLPAATLKDLGLDYASLSAIKPDIVLAAVSAFGPTGPYAERVGFDGVGQAMSGAVWLSGDPGQPTKSFASWVDFTTALFASHATLAALMRRRETGQGGEVQASLFGSAVTVMNLAAMEQALTGIGRQATGNRGQSGGPMDIIKTRDGWIMVQVLGDPLFRRWARLMGEPRWLEDPKFASDAARAENSAELSARSSQWAAERTTDEALAALAQARVPAGPVLSPQQVVDDPHVHATGIFQPMDYPGLTAPAPVSLSGARIADAPASITRRAPTLGEHTDEVLGALGYAAAEIAELRAGGVI
jgi:crotonobetainyl-CoA:carnitine CoA-transferase CaiB-like acyl-CoA transferase